MNQRSEKSKPGQRLADYLKRRSAAAETEGADDRSEAAAKPSPLTCTSIKHCDQPGFAVDSETESGNDFESFPYQVSRSRCQCRFCPSCSYAIGHRQRAQLMEVAKTFRKMLMLTFTIKSGNFKEGGEAYDYVKQKRLISRTIRTLKKRKLIPDDARWYYVLEVHKSGFPHWHMIIETNFIPHNVIYKIWNSYSPTDEVLGSVNISQERSKQFRKEPAHAANYITKYIIKPPENDWPKWVLERSHIRRFEHSRLFFEGYQEKRERHEKTTDKENTERKFRPVHKRLFSCGLTSVIVKRVVDKAGEVKNVFVEKLSASWDVVCKYFERDSKRFYLSVDRYKRMLHDLDPFFYIDRERRVTNGSFGSVV